LEAIVSSFSYLVDLYSAPVRELVIELAALINASAPGAREAVRVETRCLRYSHARCGYFCGLYPQASSVQLLFEFGVLLPDPEGVLEGDGPHVRFATAWPNQPLRMPALGRLVAAAYGLPRKRADKLAMVEALAQQRQYDELLEGAVLHGTLEDVQRALAGGANPSGRAYDIPPLFRACIHRGDDDQRHEIARLLLAAGANPNCEYNGRPLLAYIQRIGREELLHLLVEHGAVLPPELPARVEVVSAHGLAAPARGQWPERAYRV
jgi:hypothetical protein